MIIVTGLRFKINVAQIQNTGDYSKNFVLLLVAYFQHSKRVDGFKKRFRILDTIDKYLAIRVVVIWGIHYLKKIILKKFKKKLSLKTLRSFLMIL